MHKTHYAQEERKRIHECKYMKIVYVTQLRNSSEKKNIGARTGFQPITTAIPVQRSTVTSRTDLNFFGPYFHYHWNSASDRESLLEFSGPITEGRNS